MLKFIFVGGLLLALILGYTNHNSTTPVSDNTPSNMITAPWSGMAIGGKAFWADQAKAGTALWKSSLRWCLREYSNQTQPTVAQGVCTIVLSVNSDINGSPTS